MPHADRDQRLAYLRAYRRENPDLRDRAEYKREYRTRRKERNRAFVQAAKDAPCSDCGVRYPYYVMEFDHRDGETKTMMISALAQRGATLEAIQSEIDKCDLVCSNCHAIRSYRRMFPNA